MPGLPAPCLRSRVFEHAVQPRSPYCNASSSALCFHPGPGSLSAPRDGAKHSASPGRATPSAPVSPGAGWTFPPKSSPFVPSPPAGDVSPDSTWVTREGTGAGLSLVHGAGPVGLYLEQRVAPHGAAPWQRSDLCRRAEPYQLQLTHASGAREQLAR